MTAADFLAEQGATLRDALRLADYVTAEQAKNSGPSKQPYLERDAADCKKALADLETVEMEEQKP